MTAPDHTDPLLIPERRADALRRVMDYYEIDEAPDSTVPYASGPKVMRGVLRRHPRYAVLSQYDDHGRWRVTLATDELAQRGDSRSIEQRAAVDLVAAHLVTQDELVHCYFDLDVLEGPAPSITEGDKVRLTDEGREFYKGSGDAGDVFYAIGSETDISDGTAYEKIYISRDENASMFGDGYEDIVDEAYLEVVEYGAPDVDDRLPRRYQVADVHVIVVFNTVPTTTRVL